jgi:BirA family biotin operon repressor/biotin-[acetyl-CoA-carboxylase] ligase
MKKSRIYKLRSSGDKSLYVHHFSCLDSTNIEAAKMAKNNARSWTVVVADEQTEGKGRYNRQWESTSRLGLYFSIILRPKLDIRYLNLLNLSTALTIRNFLWSYISINPLNSKKHIQLKWPNDVLVDQKKICGILLKSSIMNNKLNHVIVGIGLNINHSTNDFSENLKKKATSLYIETGRKWVLEEILTNFLNSYVASFPNWTDNEISQIIDQYEKNLLFRYQNVKIKLHETIVSGILKGVDQFGHLCLLSTGEEKIISSCDLWEMNENDISN